MHLLKSCALISLIFLIGCNSNEEVSELITPYEVSDSLETATYDEAIAWWRKLEEASPFVCVKEFGETDAGKPLHIVLINASRNFNFETIKQSGKTILLINNGIHPGEPDGIDASMLYAREILSAPDFSEKFDSLVIMIIPVYNIGGALNRNCCSRANQNGPEGYGFRGNAKNLDLNRDFSKADSKNALSFIELFAKWNPDVYLETHVSNGADYPYTMTYLVSHPDKMTEPLGAFVKQQLIEPLKQKMIEQNDEMIPYVNLFGTPPDSGYTSFYDSPRYSTGYAALHNSIGLLTETHMLKPFKQRVESTLSFLRNLGETLNEQSGQIKKSRQLAEEKMLSSNDFVLDWEIDKNKFETLSFKGYRAYYDTSLVTGAPQLYYDRSQTWEKDIEYYASLKPTISVSSPEYYLVPASWSAVVDRLKLNGVIMTLLDQDTLIEAMSYKIKSYKTSTEPYEGHYFHYDTEIEKIESKIFLRKNEYFLISSHQKTRRFLVEMLDPQGPDSYFNWNFYDEILQQKEWFSSYIFDREAEEMLKNPDIKEKLDSYVKADSVNRNNPKSKLIYLYTLSDHYEESRHMIYPVYRIE